MELKWLITVKKKSEKRKREIWKIMGLMDWLRCFIISSSNNRL